jgi:L-fucose isomerase-like protein
MTAGLLTFDFPPGYRRADLPPRPTAVDSPLARLLAARGVTVVNPVAGLSPEGIRHARDLDACVDVLHARRVDCLILDVFHWFPLSLAAQAVRDCGVPAAVYANTRNGWNGVPAATAAAGSMDEAAGPTGPVERFLDTHPEEIMPWITGVSALARMRRSRIMAWGGSSGADMPYTRSDPAALERLFVAEVMTEQESVLLEKARQILSGSAGRVKAFRDWLEAGGATLAFDDRMLTRDTFSFQAALYLAARDRLKELEPMGVAAGSLKCHYEMSISPVGCTGCFLPAFLPFAADGEGERPVIPFACEGDLNAVMGLLLLSCLNPAAPPLFGDLAAYAADHVLMRNCGAASLWWAARSPDPAAALPRVRISANMHGRSGGAVGYETPAGGPVTFLRLFRRGGRFMLFLGEGTVMAEGEGSRYADPWPHTRLVMPVDTHLLFKTVPCNHGSLAEGALAAAAEVLCARAGVRVVRCDSEESLREHLRRVRGEAGE